jgi:hypothetical protein
VVAALVLCSIVSSVAALPYLVFGVWLVRRTGDPSSLRDAAAFVREIPHARLGRRRR